MNEKIGKKDLSLLRAIDEKPRSSFKQLGKATRTKAETTHYRFKRLEERGIITGFFALINVAKMGYATYKLLVKYKSVTQQIRDEIIAFVKETEIISWAGSCEGRWDLMLTIVAPSSREFIKLSEAFFSRFGKHFREKEVLIPIDTHFSNEKYLTGGELTYWKQLDFHARQEQIDERNRTLLKEISKDGRSTFTEIGEKIGLTYWAVSQRFKKLKEEEILVAIKPRIDFRKLGYQYYHLLLEVENEEVRQKITTYYKMHPSCIMLMNHVGKYSLHLEFVLEKEMATVLMDLRERFGEQLGGYEPLLIVEEYVMNLLR